MGSGFDPSSPYYDESGEMQGGEPISSTFHYVEHSNVFGQTVDDGHAEAFRKVQEGLDRNGELNKKADAWGLVASGSGTTSSTLSRMYTTAFSAWSGDDADKAKKIFSQTITTANALVGYTGQMRDSTVAISEAVAKAKGTASDSPGFTDRLQGGIGIGGGGDGDGAAAMQAYFDLVGAVTGARDNMPTQVEWQIKTDPSSSGPTHSGTNVGGPGSGPGVSGPGSAPHAGTATAPHTSIPTSTTKDPGTIPQPHITNPGNDHLTPPDNTDGIPDTSNGIPDTSNGIPDTSNGIPGTTTPVGPGAYPGSTFDSSPGGLSAVPGLDSGSSLAGFDGSGGSGLAGAGGGGLGSASGIDGGGSGLSGAGSGLSGAGSGLSGAGSGLSGGGAGAGGTGAGAGGTGGGAGGGRGMGAGMMPMRGGGQGDDEERERSTWLNEDEDVWGESDAPPSVIN